LAACTGNQNNTIIATDKAPLDAPSPFRLYSNAFKDGENIPSIYTCDSSDISPELHWNNPFKNTASFTLIADDPDAPMGTWVHWIVYNIPAKDTLLKANIAPDSVMGNGTKQGNTSFRKIGYGGPCPPNGIHRYYFKLYALDTLFALPAGKTKQQLLNAMKGHILAEADLMGKYKKLKNNK
jgi:Raf kinase inhibitor-like YbhB/YbcL family protein